MFFVCLLELVEIRLYLGALLCIFLFSYCFVCWVIHGRGRYIYCFICFLFHYLLIYIYELFINICLYFALSEIKNLFCLLVFSTYAVMHFVKCFGKYTVDSIELLSTLATDG